MDQQALVGEGERMPGSFTLGTIAGIRLQVSHTWIAALALVVATLATSWFPDAQPGVGAPTYIGLGLIGALLLLLSVLVHEAAHVAVARSRALRRALSADNSTPPATARSVGLQRWVHLVQRWVRMGGMLLTEPLGVSRITLYPFGGVSDLDAELRDPGSEFRLDAWGPLANFILAGVAASLQAFFLGQNDLAAALFGYLDAANVILGLLSLLPGYPLDGGRVLRAVLAQATGDAEKATHWSLLAGQVVAYLLMLWGIVQFFVGGSGSAGAALWLVFIGWFLLLAARHESRRAHLDALLGGITVGEVMRPAPPAIPASATLQQVADEHLLARGVRAAPVIKAGRVAGLIALAELLRTPREEWPRTTVGAAMTPLDRLAVASPEQPLAQALTPLAARDVNQLPVLLDGQVVGMLGRDALLSALGPHEKVAIDGAATKDETPAQIPEKTPRVGG
jgi:Zn-dependent protease